MTHFALDSPAWLWLLFLIPLLLNVAARAERLRKRALNALADPEAQAQLISELDPRRRRQKALLLTAACGLAVLALCRPAWDRTAPAPSDGRDIVVLLDVSRSMYAEDVAPSRLEVARHGLTAFAARLRGDRIGLVAFAGNAALRCPLTSDYGFFGTAVEGTSPDSVTLGGTEIAKAIHFALKDAFDDLSRRTRYLLLVTDAEDHGHAAIAAVAEATRRGIRLDVLGLGDAAKGGRVPVDSVEPIRYVTYQGQEVWSKLNEPAIHNLADAGGGNALVIGPAGHHDLGAALDRLISGARGKPVLPRVQAFPIPLALAVACLALQLILSERRVR